MQSPINIGCATFSLKARAMNYLKSVKYMRAPTIIMFLKIIVRLEWWPTICAKVWIGIEIQCIV